MLQKWCGKPWLITMYVIGAMMAALAAVQWQNWAVPKRFLCLLSILLPLHVFEENTWPAGFHYMMNLVQKSNRPNEGPMNRLTDMISNLGAEILFLLLFLWGGDNGTCILTAFFGIGETMAHLLFGTLVLQKLKHRGMKTLYGPGLASALLTLLPLSFAAIRWLMLQTITGSDVLIGVLLIAAVILGLIRMPMMTFGRYQPEYAFSSNGYFRRFTNQ